jgi:predicted 2-oxoglutarate/Fe(II)-dependent dioxygenase YbiX
MINDPSEKDEIYLANVAKIGDSVDNIIYIENVLSPQDHSLILDYARSTDGWVKQPWVSSIVESQDLPKEIIEMLNSIFELVYKKAIDVYDVKINNFRRSALHLVKFFDGSHLEPHVDTLSAEQNHIASVYYINDDYTGGEINFTEHNLKIKPKANSLIIFPGNENYVHEVCETVGKDRYSSAMWFQFTGSTFSKKSEWYGDQ